MMKKYILLMLCLMLSKISLADWHDDVRLGDPEYGGTGCPAGTAAVALSPDAKALSMLFDQFYVEAGGQTGRSLDRKNCSIAVPVHVPNGYSVSIFQIDYRGFNSLPFGGYSRFNVEYFFAGQEGPGYVKQFNGRLEDQFLLNNTLAASAVTWSACGQSVILRANTGMLVRTNSAMQSSYASLDSMDLSAGLVFSLQYRRCGS